MDLEHIRRVIDRLRAEWDKEGYDYYDCPISQSGYEQLMEALETEYLSE